MKIYKVHFLYFVANQPISFAERTFIIFIFFEKMMFKNLLVFWDTVRLFKLLLIDSLYISIIYKYNKKNQKWYFFEFFFVGKIGLEPITWYTTLQKCLLYVPFARSVCIKHLFYPLNYFPLVEEERFEQPVVVIPQWFRNQHIKPLCHISNKRRGRDSNPRDPFESADLANRCLKPLGHLSKSQGSSLDLTQTKQFYICCMNLYFSSIINITKFLLLWHRKESNIHILVF